MEINIGDRLRHYITNVYGNIKTFAKKSNINGNQLSFYLNDVRIPGGEVLQKFSELGLNINWLLTGRGAMLLIDNEDLLQSKAQNILNETKKLIEKELGVQL